MDQNWHSSARETCYLAGFNARILGPVQVAYHNRTIAIPIGRQRAVLAALLLDANEVVTVGDLLDRIWADGGPRSPRAALHTIIARLRGAFDVQRAGLSSLIHTVAAGYRIEVDPNNFDLTRFRNLITRAGDASVRGDFKSEAVLLNEALSYWCGPVLSDVQPHSLDWHAVPQLNEELLAAQERLHDVMLAMGRHDDKLTCDLRRLVHRYPFRERFWRQLIQALHQANRRTEALQTFAELSAYLRDELGIDPSREVRDLHLSILRDDPTAPSEPMHPQPVW